ncbi:Ribosome-associated heat shock protein [Methylophaga thiooxydans]|uniref:Heat shock protein 15 n=1 Tax=Methylophaga thiooxydans TaxID=392484 RepID=A0A0A0BGP3_9GAMM|nr:S4 domain-containing protein [Methylophaga thiooxydans]KGM06847.1 Ribosome-associated heat shock protein [Methylophaga thiooxydans]
MAKQDTSSESQRLDKWLWAARFYKTRSLAVEAINGGKVHLNKQRAKPSRTVRVEDTLTISKPPYEFEIIVAGLNLQRRPAAEAQQLYQETPDSQKKREALREQIKNEPLGFRQQKGRPSKRDRRHIIKFTRQT